MVALGTRLATDHEGSGTEKHSIRLCGERQERTEVLYEAGRLPRGTAIQADSPNLEGRRLCAEEAFRGPACPDASSSLSRRSSTRTVLFVLPVNL